MHTHLGGVVIDEMADLMERDSPEFCPFTERADRGLLACRKEAAATESKDIGELAGDDGGR